MQPQLDAIVAQLESAQERLRGLTKGLPDHLWSTRPRPDSWSIAECVAHLNLTSQAYIPMLRAAFSDARFTGQRGPRLYRRDLVGWIVSLSAGPLPRVGEWRFGRVKTIAAFVPGGDLDRATTLDEFDRLQDELIELSEDAEDRPLERMRIVSPFDARVTYNAYSALVILPRHQQRHLWQAEHMWRGLV